MTNPQTVEKLLTTIEEEKALGAIRRDALDALLLEAEEIERQIDLAVDEVAESQRELGRLHKQKSRLQKIIRSPS